MKTVLLGDVAQIISGQSPRGEFYNNDGEGLPLYQGKKDFGAMFTADPSVWTTETTKVAEPNDILISVRAPVGPVNFAAQRMNIGRGLAAIRPWEGLDPKFLFRYLQYKEAEIATLGGGTTFQSINRNHLKNLAIPYPGVEEQKRIVKKLDGAFAAIDKAKQNTEKNLKNSREILETRLNSIFASKTPSWRQKTLGEIYDVRDGTHDSPKYQSAGYPLVTSKNLKNHKIDLSKVSYISDRDYHEINKRSGVSSGDILFAMIGTIGNPVVIKEEPNYAIKNIALFKVPPGEDNHFLKYYLDSKNVQDKMAREANGTTQKFVGLGYLRKFPIYLPSLAEQKEIVAKLDKLSEQTQKLQELYRKKLEILEELRQSILKQAFEGKL